MKGGEKTEEKQWMWVFLIHSARSNEISPVTAAHMHGIGWHRQIWQTWQTLKQNILEVCIHVEAEEITHFYSVTKFLTSKFLFASNAKASVLALKTLSVSSSLLLHRRSGKTSFCDLCFGCFVILMKCSPYKDKRTENIWRSLYKGI